MEFGDIDEGANKWSLIPSPDLRWSGILNAQVNKLSPITVQYNTVQYGTT